MFVCLFVHLFFGLLVCLSVCLSVSACMIFFLVPDRCGGHAHVPFANNMRGTEGVMLICASVVEGLLLIKDGGDVTHPRDPQYTRPYSCSSFENNRNALGPVSADYLMSQIMRMQNIQ